MRNLYFFLIFTFSGVYSQELHHQMLSSQGKSVELSNGFYVSQTVGQQSVIGNYTKEGKIYSQGYQQSVWNRHINNNSNYSVTTVPYPNPFDRIINFQFSKPIKETILITLYDVRGREIFSQENKADEILLTVKLPQLSSGNYLVRLSAQNFIYYTQILKKE